MASSVEESKSNEFAEECPVQLVLNLPELLEVILDFCGSSEDLKTLLNARLVSRFWKNCVYSALLKIHTLLPFIVAGDKGFLTSKGYTPPCRTIESVMECFQPSSKIPLKLTVNESWNEIVANFLHRFSSQVAVLHHYSNRNCNIQENIFQFELPALEHSKLTFLDLGTDVREEFRELLELWKNFVESANGLKSVDVELGLARRCWHSVDPLEVDDPVFDLLPTNRITRLECPLSLLEYITSNHDVPKLKRLKTWFDGEPSIETQEDPVPSRFFSEEGGNLTELEIAIYNYRCFLQIGLLQNLRVLKLNSGCWVLSPGQPIPYLLPNLTKIDVNSVMGSCWIVDSLTESGVIFENVVELVLNENSTSRLGMPPYFTRLTACFANLTILRWGSAREMEMIMDDVHCIFSHLKHLEHFKLRCRRGTPFETFKLLTCILPTEIPTDISTWVEALTNNPQAICNLKRLKSLQMWFLPCDKGFIYPSLASYFLFFAAFFRIPTLTSIRMNLIGFDPECIRIWKDSGREFSADWLSGYEQRIREDSYLTIQ